VNREPAAPRPADNPFASRRIDALGYRFHRGAIDDIETALALHGNRGAIVGPHGSGKTTLLEELAVHLSGIIVRVRLDTEIDWPVRTAIGALPTRIGPDHAVLIDGAEQLGPLSWRRVHHRIRHAGTIVITSHRPGRLPTIHECTTDVELLKSLIAELAPEGVDAVDFEGLFHRHNGNIRLCFRELYDACSK
jgi:ABC-type dipeptide/oligopeptide/nickel transport system ATPase subunit